MSGRSPIPAWIRTYKATETVAVPDHDPYVVPHDLAPGMWAERDDGARLFVREVAGQSAVSYLLQLPGIGISAPQYLTRPRFEVLYSWSPSTTPRMKWTWHTEPHHGEAIVSETNQLPKMLPIQTKALLYGGATLAAHLPFFMWIAALPTKYQGAAIAAYIIAAAVFTCTMVWLHENGKNAPRRNSSRY